MHLRNTLLLLLTGLSMALSAQTQSWQWVKAGGSTSDNNTVQPAECKIAGCDAYGNVYAVGMLNGPNIRFDSFSSPGTYGTQTSFDNYLLFSYSCAGDMRWAIQIGDDAGGYNGILDPGVVTDVQGNTYFACTFFYGNHYSDLPLYLGDTILPPTSALISQPYLCMIKYDSLGRLVWFKNFQCDTTYTSLGNVAYGLRIGSSGNIWMACYLDSNYAISPNFHTTFKGKYNVEVDPASGNILGGYYTSNQVFGNSYDVDTYYDLDENENYYETGTLYSASADTLILANQKIAPDTGTTFAKPYIFSLDKNGNFRFIITPKNYCSQCTFSSCKYDFGADRFVTCWGLNNGDIYGNDTFYFNSNNLYRNSTSTNGLFAIDTIGNILWGKYITNSDRPGSIPPYLPSVIYGTGIKANGILIYNNVDTLFNKDTTSSGSDYSEITSQFDKNGNLLASNDSHIGVIGTGINAVKYGGQDWRGNVYLGGTFSNFIATPADSVVNTDAQSGNFFIAKLGISDCSCPSPGVQFTQTSNGDTAYFDGSTLNHSDSIHWEFGDGTTASGDTFKHVYAQNGTYTVTAIAYSGCGVDSITKQVTVRNVGISVVEPDKTNLYPNPATNAVNLEVSGAATIGLVFANGSSAWDHPVQVSQSGTYVFDMAKYSSGLYYFIVQYTNGKVDVMQVVKE